MKNDEPIEGELMSEALALPQTHGAMTVARDPKVVLEEARKAAKALAEVLNGKKKKVMFNGEQYLEFEDWQTVARFYGVTAKVVSTQYIEYGETKGFEARAVALLLSNGMEVSGADAMCLNDESKWSTRPKYQWKNGQRIQIGEEAVPLFQLRSMAQTRACAKALRNVLAFVPVLAGYKPTPAEEMDGTESTDTNHAKAAAPAAQPTKRTSTGTETVTLTPYKEGFVALSGPGLPIVRANLDNKLMAELGWKWEGSVAVIPAKNGFRFVDMCTRHNVGTTWMDAPTRGPLAPPKANIPLPPEVDEEPEPSNGSDPIITFTKRVRGTKPGAKEYLSLEWDGKRASCWDKKLWPHLEHHEGRPAVLTLETKGQYKNVVGIVSLEGKEFFDEPVDAH